MTRDSATEIATQEVGALGEVAAASVELVALTDRHGLGTDVVDRPAWRVSFSGISTGTWEFELAVFVDADSGRVLVAATSGPALWERGVGDATAYVGDWVIKGVPDPRSMDHSIMDVLTMLAENRPPASEVILRPRIAAPPLPARVAENGRWQRPPLKARWIHDAIFIGHGGLQEFLGFMLDEDLEPFGFAQGNVPWDPRPGFELEPPSGLGYIE